MASYDGESSASEDENYSETNVLLGYASKEPTDDTVSQLGGVPTWLAPTSPPSGAFAKCKVCSDLMTLLLQLNGDLPEHFPSHERRLYILHCRRRTCRRKEGSVRALRAVRISETVTKETPKKVEPQKPEDVQPAAKQDIGAALFGSKPTSGNTSANPFAPMTVGAAASNPFSTSNANPFSTGKSPLPPTSTLASKPPQPPAEEQLPATFADKVRISAPPSTAPADPLPAEPWPSDSAFPPAYPKYYFDAEYETLDAPSTPAIPSQAMVIDESGSSADGGSGKEDKETFESTIDKTFQKFADRLAQNPDQVLRYEFRGQPLLYNNMDAVASRLGSLSAITGKVSTVRASGSSGMPRCTNCGAQRVFELQLTPQAIAELEVDEMGLEGMEWGTIIVGVCSEDCKPSHVQYGEVGYLEEWAGVQWEEVTKKG